MIAVKTKPLDLIVEPSYSVSGQMQANVAVQGTEALLLKRRRRHRLENVERRNDATMPTPAMDRQTQNDRIFLVGNPTRDRIVRSGKTVKTLGGTVLYAGLFFIRCGIPVSIVGNGDEKMQAWIESNGIDSEHFTLTARITSFENRYTAAGRQQTARAGKKIRFSDVPQSVFSARAVLIGTVLGEADPRMFRPPHSGLWMLDVQGLLRDVGTAGEVILRTNPALEKAIAACDIVKADQQEAAAIAGTADPRQASMRLHQMGAGIVVITLAAKGSCLSDGRRFIRIRPPQTRAADPTGAGDVYDAGFLAAYLRTGDLIEAGCFGSAAAALSTAGVGTTAVPSCRQVERAVRDHYPSERMVAVTHLS